MSLLHVELYIDHCDMCRIAVFSSLDLGKVEC